MFPFRQVLSSVSLAATLLVAPTVALASSDTSHCKGLPTAEIGPCVAAAVDARPKPPKIQWLAQNKPKFRTIDSQSPVDCRKLKGGEWKAYEPLTDAIGWECYDANNKTHVQYVKAFPSAAETTKRIFNRSYGYTSRPSSGRFSRTCSISTVETSTGYSTTLTCR